MTATGYNDTVIDAWDFEKQVFRTFAKSKISEVKLLEIGFDANANACVKRVNVNDLPANFATVEGVRKGFEADGYLCYTGSCDGSVIAIKPPKIEPELTANIYTYDKTGDVSVFHPDNTLNVYLNVYMGKCLGLYVRGGVITLHHGATKVENPTVDEFVKWAKSLGDK